MSKNKEKIQRSNNDPFFQRFPRGILGHLNGIIEALDDEQWEYAHAMLEEVVEHWPFEKSKKKNP